MLLLAATLPKTEYEISFIALWQRGAWASEAEALGFPVHVLGLSPEDCAGLRPRCAIAALRAVRTYLKLARRLDIVDAWLVPSFTFAGFAQPIARVPVLLGGRRNLLGHYAKKPWYRKLAASWATRQTRAVVSNSRAAAEETVTIEHVDRSRVHVIPNAVVPFETAPHEREDRRRAWSFAPDEIVVGCIANYNPGKGLDTVLEVAGRLRETAPELRFVLVGEGPLRDRLAETIDRLGLGSVVRLNGLEEEARRLYPAFDIVLQASDSEGLPNVVLEAASAGRAIVATAVGGTPEVLTNDVDGILIPPGDAAAMEAAILRLAKDAPLRDRLARAAEERAGYFSAARLAGDTSALYRRLLADRRRT